MAIGSGAYETIKLLSTINNLQHHQRVQFFKNLPDTGLKQITELLFNFLLGTFSIPLAGLKALRFLKKDIRLLADIKVPKKKARQLLSSTRGLFIIHTVLPHALKSIQG